MNLDGPRNQVVEVETVSDPMGPQNPHGNAFYTKSTVFKTELEARRSHKYETARTWVVQNPSSKNRMGTNVGYKLQPMESLCRTGAPSRRLRGAPAISTITSGSRRTIPRSGSQPVSIRIRNPGPDGLPVWTRKNRNIENTEIVVWYNFGHHHIPRLEDWPLMPVAKLGFMLKPVNFFDTAACMDVPPSQAKKGCSMADERGFSTNKISA
jgi:primary-amine oxidase